MYRSCLEGMAYGLRHNIETMSEVGALPKRLIAVGGGTKDPVWLQACSDVTGMPQDVPERTLGAAYGDAYLAGYAAGLFTDSKPLKQQWVKIARVVEPIRETAALYDDLYGVYRRLYVQTKDEMHRVAHK
jgi:xylulokinase